MKQTTTDTLRIAGALAGVIVGAGFASGQEIMQFFTGFGSIGFLGGVVSAALFVILSMIIATIGQMLNAQSHKEFVIAICGKYLGAVVDWLITFFMFAVGVVMLAGGGALIKQFTGIPSIYGAILVTILTVLIVCLDVRKVVTLIGSVTPLLMVMVVIVAIYAIATRTATDAELVSAAAKQPRGAPNWLLAAVLYVSYNVVAGIPFLVIMGGGTKDRKVAAWGGILGGALLGALILVISAAMFAQLNKLQGVPMPTLLIASDASSILGIIMGITIFGMILNTSVGMFYSFSARIFTPGTSRFRWGTVIAGVVALIGSLIGFIKLVGTVYPFFGYLGFVLMACTLIGWWRFRNGMPSVAMSNVK